MNDVTFVIFGATGDLTKRKLIPALYSLMVAHKLPKNFIIIGAAQDNINGYDLAMRAHPFIKQCTAEHWQSFIQHVYYKQVNFRQAQDFKQLHDYIHQIEARHQSSGNNRIAYLAVSSDFFCLLTQQLAETTIIEQAATEKAHRIIYEKPFGKDLQSAQEINNCISNYFPENQIYRIDHYLTKELVSNITLLRFTNCFFEPLWNSHYIDQVQIIVDEKVGVEGRGAYYDEYGVLRDFVQNHMLQLLALIAMEAPEKLSGEPIRNERLRVLEKTRIANGILGQYEGYTHELNVAKNSTTATFALLQAFVDNERWQSVPFYLKTGKCLHEKETIIHIVFKPTKCRLVYGCPVKSNYITIRIDPNAGFSLHLNAKKLGSLTELMPVVMDFCHSCIMGDITPTAYEVVLEEVLRGEQSIVVRFDEIEAAWRIVDAFQARNLPIYPYAKGSDGPEQCYDFSNRYGIASSL